MKAQAYEYPSPTQQSSCFRGFTKEYTNSPEVIVHTCRFVRGNKLQALEDAKKLIKSLQRKKTHETR